MNKYGFVYIWYDSAKSKRNDSDHIKRWYVGYHWGSINDGYICSSDWMRDAYRRRPEDFKRRIIKTNIQTKIETKNEEDRWLQMMKKEELGKRYYNLKNNNSYSGVLEHSKDSKEKISVTSKGRIPWNKGKKCLPHTEEWKQLMSEKMSGVNNPMYGTKGEKSPNFGKKYTETQKENISKSWTNKRKTIFKEKMSGKNHPFFGKHHSKKSNEKNTISHSKTYIITDPDNNEFEITNLKKWCNENNMNQGHMAACARKERNHHKNFRCRYK